MFSVDYALVIYINCLSTVPIYTNYRTYISATFNTPYFDKLIMVPLYSKNSLDMQAIKNQLSTKIIGRTIHGFDTINSTNSKARILAIEDADEGTVIFAEVQSSGKGRLNREWSSPKGGLWLSIILRPNIKPTESTRMTLMAGVVVAKVLIKIYGLDARIKWPNDVMIGDKKVCGILTELRTIGGEIEHLILGIGINVNFDLEELPKEIRKFSTTLKHEMGKKLSLIELSSELLNEMDEWYDILISGKYDRITSLWKELSDTLGKQVKITTQKESVEGVALDIEDDGGLIVDDAKNGRRKFLAGDILYVSKII
jgi:BirA family biotin operon repressor/biotin-[acetyl-CoA-carboxylase] ligase